MDSDIEFLEHIFDQMKQAGLIETDDAEMNITAKGRLFVRALSMVFDAYFGRPTASSYSKLI